MNNLNLDKYLNIANEEKLKRKMDNYIPFYPMLRCENNNLFIGVLLTHEEDNVWDIKGNVKPEYWILIDPISEKIISFNKTEEKDFVIGQVIPKNTIEKEKELSKYTVEKTLQYQNYLIDDIKNEQIPIQKKLSSILGNEIIIDNEKININDYLLSNLEEEIKTKVKDLVDILIASKYGSITFYYDELLNQIINDYKEDKKIDKEKIKLCINIMNYYYDGVVGIDNFFNI